MTVNECDGVILCGGLGKRLQGIVHDVPKVMAQVDGHPVLEFIIEFLKSQNIERVVLCTGHKADMVEQYYRRQDCGVTIDFSTEHEPLGTGGALKNAREVILSDPFFVLNGDSLLSVALQDFLDFHRGKKSLASMLVAEVKDGKDFGSLEIDENQRVIHFHEKDQGAKKRLVNAGIYCFSQTIFSCMPKTKKFSLENDFFPSLIGKQFYGYCTDQEFVDIGTPERYASAKQKLQFKPLKIRLLSVIYNVKKNIKHIRIPLFLLRIFIKCITNLLSTF